MEIQKLIKRYPEEFKKIGAIFYSLNYIEIELIIFLTDFYSDPTNHDSEKTFLINDALFDNKIFSSFENKRMFLNKIVEEFNRISIEKDIPFCYEKWKTFSKSLLKVQEIRNTLAHHHLNFINDQKTVGFTTRMKAKERIESHKRGIKNVTLKRYWIDLDTEIFEIDKVSRYCASSFSALQKECNNILKI
ncbi:MAG TPA: hypothetical protein VK671_09665 [Mucilaginibacter sp.]|jgi:hypothetical protein|nr:hypothetical protein [Mucilaginibacter sp.]